ncbi:nucleoside hydrolase-like domain-containing protein [Shumkonia mesophila]|uniref:nucleoside hydrolase-like domain-containing protein n=1 Tax=Shumkonia mesophila TaxID=2838854 RepID=UPI0029349141|nr:nucleoside hydrolase-like domain-containing protein [Shumkonia mesophila]
MAKPRVLISTDIGGSDPDDIQSMVHALLYSDKVNLVGLVSSPTKHGGRASDIHKVIDAYAQDYSKLKTWSSDHPTPDYLKSIVTQGSIPVAPSQGWSSATAGSKAIIKAAHASSEPLWVLTWGAMTDVAQALHDDPSIQSKIKVYSIGAWNTQQDPAARDYVYNNFKNLWWIENDSTFRGMYVNDSGSATNTWKMGDAQGHGALGETFYKAMPWGLKMGDTPSLLYLLDGADNNNPGAASWGGSFAQTGHGPNYWTDKTSAADKCGSYEGADTVQDYQAAFYKDFVTRLDHAKAANPNGSTPPPSGGGDTTPPPSGGGSTPPPPSSGGTGNPVIAVDDTGWTVGAGQTMWQNARYLTANDKGLDGGLKVTAVAAKSAAGATVTFDSDGTISYRPLAGWQGKDSVQYTVSDKDGSSDTGTFHVQVGKGGTTVPPPSDGGSTTPPPSSDGSGNPVVAVDDAGWSTNVGQTMWQNARYLLINDQGLDGGLKVTAVASKSAAGASVSFASDGTMTYRPVANWQGKDNVAYTVTDKDGSSDTGVYYVQVGKGGVVMPSSEGGTTPPPSSSGGSGNPVNAVDDLWTTQAGKALYFNTRYLLGNDKAPDGGLAVKGIAATTAKGGTVTWDANTGTAIYKAKAGFTGHDTVQYVAQDADGSTDTALVHFDVLLA